MPGRHTVMTRLSHFLSLYTSYNIIISTVIRVDPLKQDNV